MIYKIAICDDDEKFLKTLNNKIKDYFNKNKESDYILTQFNSAQELLNDPYTFDIIFLDIEMPGISGLRAKEILERNKFLGSIVFVSNYEQYMNEAFGKNVIAYIPKNEINRITDILKQIDENENRDRILRIADTNIKIFEVHYIESHYGYCTIHTETESHLFSINLIDLLKRINSGNFMIVHRSFIVHFKYIKSFTSNEIILLNGEKIKLSRKYREKFKEKYFNYLKEN